MQPTKPGKVRIIAGKWRGRQLGVPADSAVRPTPDRVRETVFNWLAPQLPGAHCLDLFAGTGVLGFEALSRGAAHVTFVDHSPLVIHSLQQIALQLATNEIEIYRAEIPAQLQKPPQPYSVVFVDPPYQSALLLPTCHFLAQANYLAETAYVYLESDQLISDNDLPANWHVRKCKQAGCVFYHLVIADLGG